MAQRREIQAAGGPVRGTFLVPPSKSFLNRALTCAALAWGHSLILDVHEVGEDVRVMMAALNRLGVRVEGPDSGGTIHVPGQGGSLRPPQGPLEVGETGTAARFLTAMALRAPGPVRLEAEGRMRVRPMEDLLAALEGLGAVVMRPADGSFPLVVDGRGVRGGTARLPGGVSSQFASALLLVAPALPEGLRLEMDGPLVSAPYLYLTLELLQVFGARIWGGEAARAWDVEPGGLEGLEISAPGDASSALFPLAAAAVTGGRVRVKGIPPAWTQADLEALDILSASGCRAWHRYLSLVCCGSPTRGVRADLSRCPDAAPALAMVAATAPGPSRLEGLGTLPGKESDRLACLVDNLKRLGGVARAGDDWLEIDPAPLHGGEIDPRGDHRIAMAFAVLGLRVPGIAVRDPGCVSKSWPSFWSVVEEMEPGPG